MRIFSCDVSDLFQKKILEMKDSKDYQRIKYQRLYHQNINEQTIIISKNKLSDYQRTYGYNFIFIGININQFLIFSYYSNVSNI